MTSTKLPPRLAFLASHRGSNMQAILAAIDDGQLPATPALFITNNENSAALTLAAQKSIPHFVISKKELKSGETKDQKMLELLRTHSVDCVILAGFMQKLGTLVLSAYNGRILNVHPALLPKYGGKGMFGSHVHEAVLLAKDATTGVTVHLVNEDYDEGPILAQESVPVFPDDTVQTLAARVLAVEHRLYPETIKLFLERTFP